MIGSRRSFLQRAGVLTASGLTGARVGILADAANAAGGAGPRHIIHMVSDGMSSATLAIADQFSRMARQRGLLWLELYSRPGAAQAWVNMRSLNSLVTDSAAASSSWGSGSRVVNGSLNQLPDGRDLRPIFSLVNEAGWKRGLVTTTEITHATPAGFAVNMGNRGTADAIALQYLERKVDVLLGGGRKFFDPSQRKDKRDLKAESRAVGYHVAETASDLAAAPLDKRWLGLFSSGHLPYTIDHIASKDLLKKVPTLARMTSSALQRLEREERFILQVEGGRIDHACHNCDISAAVREQVAFDEAIEVCVDFQRRVSDTLIVVTADHGTANPGLNGTGTGYNQTPSLFANTLRLRRSLPEIQKLLDKASDTAAIKKVLVEETGYKVSDDKAAFLAAFLAKKGKTAYDLMNSSTAQLGQLLANYLGVGWVSTAHTADYVPLLAIGPGAERLRGFLRNTDIFHHYVELAGIDFRNPELPLMAETGPSAADVEPPDSYA